MTLFLHRQLPTYSTLLCGRAPRVEYGFRSERLQIWYNHSENSWKDAGPHYHTASDEVFIMLKGRIVVEAEGKRHTLNAREYCGFPAGLAHSVLDAHPPFESLMVRAPSIEDKIHPTDTKAGKPGGFVHAPIPFDTAFICGYAPDAANGLTSERLQIRHVLQETDWQDPAPHYHRESDEVFIVRKGALGVEAEGKAHKISAGEYVCFEAGLPHRILWVEPPMEKWVLRAPSVDDKVFTE